MFSYLKKVVLGKKKESSPETSDHSSPPPPTVAGGSPLSESGDSSRCVMALSTRVTIKDFNLLKTVGRGSFGKVFLAQKITGADAGAQYAIKTLRKDVLHKRGQVEHTRAEREILSVMQHPFIVSLKCAFQTEQKLYLVTDFCPGGELFFWLKR